MAKSNYEKMKELMRPEFLKYDQRSMIERFELRHDETWLYLPFAGSLYRVNRQTALVEGSNDDFKTVFEADYNQAMSIFDVLSRAQRPAQLSGKFCQVTKLKGLIQGSGRGVGSSFFRPLEDFFAGQVWALAQACQSLGGTLIDEAGDLAVRLPLFDFLPVILQFWDADEEFPAQIKLMWDENILDYMHYETTWFAASCLLERLRQVVAEIKQGRAEG